MGAENFTTRAKGATAEEAFANACAAARHEYGHGGYTGTIAEKHSFVRLGSAATWGEAFRLSDDLLDDVDDKWGPAGALRVGTEGWLFFGWASS